MQFLANIAIIVIAFAVIFVVVKQYILSPTAVITSMAPRTVANPDKSAGLATAAPATPVGKTIPIEGVNWKEKKQTLVLYLSTTCRYCNESVPFYQRLIKEKSEQGFEIVAILSQNPDEAESYLEKQNLKVAQVFSSSLSSLGVTATPTPLLVNPEGVVLDFWRGKLNPDKEAEVLAKLSS